MATVQGFVSESAFALSQVGNCALCVLAVGALLSVTGNLGEPLKSLATFRFLKRKAS